MFNTKAEIEHWFFEEVRIMREGTVAPIDFAYAVARKHEEALETMAYLSARPCTAHSYVNCPICVTATSG